MLFRSLRVNGPSRVDQEFTCESGKTETNQLGSDQSKDANDGVHFDIIIEILGCEDGDSNCVIRSSGGHDTDCDMLLEVYAPLEKNLLSKIHELTY